MSHANWSGKTPRIFSTGKSRLPPLDRAMCSDEVFSNVLGGTLLKHLLNATKKALYPNLLDSVFSNSLTLSALLALAAVPSVAGQGLTPTSPTQEFIYFNGRLVAVEERGSGANGDAVRAGGGQALASAKTAAVTSSAPTSANPPSIPAPSLPVPGALPKDTSTTSKRLAVTTPASTHISPPLGSH